VLLTSASGLRTGGNADNRIRQKQSQLWREYPYRLAEISEQASLRLLIVPAGCGLSIKSLAGLTISVKKLTLI